MNNIVFYAFLAGRVITGGYFLMGGLNHLMKLKMMAGYAKSKGTPAAEVAVAGTGLLLLLGGASMVLGYHPTIGAALLVVLLIGVSVGMHNFWAVKDPQAKMQEQVHFMKNMGLLGLVLMTLAIPRPWPMSLGNW